MAGEKRLSFRVDAQDDASKVFSKIASSAKSELKKVDKALDDNRTAAQAFGDFLGNLADDIDAELTGVKAAAERLGQALGPELTAKADPREVVMEMRRLGIELDDIAANADHVAAKLKQLDDVKIRHAGTSARVASGDFDRLRDSSDQSRSVLANFAGNTAQDIGQIGGAAGSAGVLIGQLAEYAVDGNIALGQLVKFVGPIAALAVVGGKLASEWQKNAETSQFMREQVEGLTEALGETASAAEAVQKVLEDTGKIELRIFDETRDVTADMAALGLTVEQFAQLVAGSKTGIDEWADRMRAAGADAEILDEVVLAAQQQHHNLAGAQERAAINAKVFGDAEKDAADKTSEANDKIERGRRAMDDAGGSASSFEGRLQGVAREEKYVADKAAEAAQGIRDLRTEVVQGLSGFHDYESAGLALADQLIDLKKSTDEYNKGVEDGTLKGDEQAQALIDLRQQQISAAKTALETATAFADQSGAQEGSRRHTRLLKDELQRLADENPAIRGEIDKYIGKLDEIKPTKPTKAEFRKQEAEDAALDYKNQLDEIKTDVHTTAHLDTADAMTAANNFEQRLNSIQDEDVHITTWFHERGPGSSSPGATPVPTGGSGESFMGGTSAARRAGGVPTPGAPPRARRLARRAGVAGARADELFALAEAAQDAAEKEELLDQANEQLERSHKLAEAAVEAHADAISREADELRGSADAARERAEGLREQASSMSDAVDAEEALEDARKASAAAARTATSNVPIAEQLEAVEEFEDAARAQAAAAVRLARERKEAAGGVFTELDALNARRQSLAGQAATAPAALRSVIEALITRFNFAGQERALREAERESTSADKFDKTADKFDRVVDRLNDGIAGLLTGIARLMKEQGTITPEELIKLLKQYERRNGASWRGGK